MKRIFSILIAISILLTSVQVMSEKQHDDIDIFIDKYTDAIVEAYNTGENDKYYYGQYNPDWVEAIDNEGKFGDLNYNNNGDRFVHIQRVLIMSAEYAEQGKRLNGNSYALSKILSALDFYINAKFEQVGNAGGWSHWLEAPTTLGEAMVLLQYGGVKLSEELFDTADYYFSQWENKTNGAYTFCVDSPSNFAVTTRLWKIIAILYNKADLIEKIYAYTYKDWKDHSDGVSNAREADLAYMSSEQRVDSSHYLGDGYYPDGSYYAHSNLPYLNGYGRQFFNATLDVFEETIGTSFGASQEELGMLVSMVLDAWAWDLFGDTINYFGIGRSFARSTSIMQNNAALIKGYAETLLKEPTIPRRDELEDLVRRIEEGEEKSYVIGNKQYWFSDMMIHHRNNYMVVNRNTSNRILRSESLGLDGQNDYYMGNGLAVYATGNEYVNIGKVWDWDRLPGLTAIQSDDDVPEATALFGYNSFVGGASNGTYGVSCDDYYDPHGNVDVKKSWFFFDDEVVALAADINSDSASDLYTSMNQCMLEGDVTYCESNEIKTLANENTYTTDNAEWIYHANVGYILPEKQKITISNTYQTGNGLRKGDDSEPYETKQIFNAGIEHGANPQKDKYSYILLPGMTQTEVDEYSKNIPVEIVRNDAEVQAVYHKNLNIIQAVFRKAAALELENGRKISVDKPCVIMLCPTEGGWEITLQNPEQKEITVNVGINENIESGDAVWSEKDGMLYVPITTQKGVYLGNSVIKYLLSDMTCSVDFDDSTKVINIKGVIPFKNIDKVYVKLTSANDSVSAYSTVNDKSEYELKLDCGRFSGECHLSVYTAGNTTPFEKDLKIEGSDTVIPVIFADTANHWIKDYASSLAAKGILLGDNNGNLNPDDEITYDQFIKMLTRIIKYSDTNTEISAEGKKYSVEVEYAILNNLLPEYVVSSEFDQNAVINREDMITIAVYMADKKGLLKSSGKSNELPGDIINATYRCYDSLKKACELGIISGDSNGLRPLDKAKRSEAIKIMSILAGSI